MNKSTKALPRPAASAETSKKHTPSAPGTLSRKAQPLTLARMDAMPSPVAAVPHHRLLSEMSGAELGGMVKALDQARGQYESLSGMCATLAGLVCIEAKEKLPHGEYLPWLKSHLGKSHTTAGQYTALAKVFVKLQPKLQFEQMTLALMDGAQAISAQSLDMTHPVVSAVAKWTDGRTFYQLKQEVVPASGGNKYERSRGKGARQKLTHEQAMELLRTVSINAMQHLRFLHDKHAYVAVKDEAELDGLLNHLEATTKAVKAWKGMTQAQRAAALTEQVKIQIQDAAKE